MNFAELHRGPGCLDMHFALHIVLLLHMEPPRIGSDLDSAGLGPIQAGPTQFETIWALRLNPFSLRFSTAWDLQMQMQVQMQLIQIQMHMEVNMQKHIQVKI